MFKIPTRGSPGCALLLASLIFGPMGLLLTFAGAGELWRAKEDPFDIIFFLGLGVLFIIISVMTTVSAFRWNDSPQSLFSSDANPLERIAHAKDSAEREIAEEVVAEVSRAANWLTAEERKVLDEVKAAIQAAPSHNEVVGILREKGGGEIIPANPMLQPIAFSMKPTPMRRYIKGIFLEARAWAAAFITIPFTPFFDVWEGGKMVLHKAMRRMRRARRYRVRPHNVFQRDDRAPVLYLRSFSDDYEDSLESFLPTTAEEKLVKSCNRRGPVMAIGTPGEDLPLLGALRIYFEDSTWQAGVLYLMSVSQLVIIQAGTAPGLLWEVGDARRRVEPQKLHISFTAWEDLDEWKRHLNYLRFKKYAEELLECELPPDIKTTSHITFAEGWVSRSQSDFSYSLPSVREKRKRIYRLVGGVLAVICALLAALLLPQAIKKVVDLTGINSYKEDPASWKRYTLDSSGMSVELPAKPTPFNEPVFAIGLIKQGMFVYEGGDLGATIGHIGYSDFVKVSGEGALKGAVDGIRQEMEVDVNYSIQQVGEGKLALDGKFFKDGKEYKLRGSSLVKDHDAWLIFVLYNSGNNAAVLAAQRILDSVKFGG